MEGYRNVPMKRLVLRISLRFLLIVGLILFVVLLLPPLLNLFLPFVLAFFAASILAPLVGKIAKRVGTAWNFWSMLFVLLLILIVTAILVLVGYYLFRQISDLLGSWNSIRENFTGILNSLSNYLETHMSMTSTDLEQYALGYVQRALGWLTDLISTWAPNVMSGVGNLATGIASFLISLLFFIVGAYFMTADYHHLRERIGDHIPDVILPHARQIKAATGTAMFGYLKAQVVLSGVVTLIIFLALLIWGQEYALIIAILCGIIDIIPFFGSGTILVPWAVIELFLGRFGKGGFLLILALCLFMFRKLAEPKVVGSHTGLPPLVSLISIYVGMKLGGVLGMILVPVLCMIVISLYGVGFFDPTIRDFKLLFYRIWDAARLEPESAEEPPEGQRADV